MWVVTGKTASNKEASYKIPASKDTDKGHVIGLAYAEHAKGHATDPLDYPSVEVKWTADNVQNIPALTLSESSNFSVEKRIAKGVWERHSVRALRTVESASEALEGAASADPVGKYRVVQTEKTLTVVAVSKNAVGAVGEVPDKPVQEENKVPTDSSTAGLIEVKAEAVGEVPDKPVQEENKVPTEAVKSTKAALKPKAA